MYGKKFIKKIGKKLEKNCQFMPVVAFTKFCFAEKKTDNKPKNKKK